MEGKIRSRGHRLAGIHGFSEGMFNHLTLAVPGVHAPIHRLNPKAAAVFHIHMPTPALHDPLVLRLGQTEITLIDRIAYDEHCTGLSQVLCN
ncbi:hypothetical protein CWO91_38000 [Bradyrhizobium genosp. SA-3]|uniref:hypothetical protein n=1 Tax=Bradyrhizobium genosp. SA-3 TaxID=508868 RepID=UPI001029FBE4|nr:hypothetical protein [Bradyrhizobium genosp. SA-3]RZM96712.1 hypothetical protein CWO91_38000 [Bradyrhizobium genosp. SA-3]